MFLIDGNNVLGTARERLVNGLSRLARAFGASSIVVFDGAPVATMPNGAVRRGVRVLYAGPQSSADARILDLLESEILPRPVTVVTSDRLLAERARARGARIASARLMRRALDQSTAA